jgi:hypothetical protein
MYFYRPAHLKRRRIKKYKKVKRIVQQSQTPIFFLAQSFTLPREIKNWGLQSALVFSTFPRWVRYVNVNNWVSRSGHYCLYRLAAEGKSPGAKPNVNTE